MFDDVSRGPKRFGVENYYTMYTLARGKTLVAARRRRRRRTRNAKRNGRVCARILKTGLVRSDQRRRRQRRLSRIRSGNILSVGPLLRAFHTNPAGHTAILIDPHSPPVHQVRVSSDPRRPGTRDHAAAESPFLPVKITRRRPYACVCACVCVCMRAGRSVDDGGGGGGA